jgi:ATP-dependent Clp protease ATP-binding subunit ClpA
VFERFTNLAKRSLTYAQDEAITLRHDFIGTEHLLLGLVRVREGVAGELLHSYAITLERARAEALRVLEAAGVPATGGREATEALAAIGIDVDEIRRRADDTFGPGRFYFPRPGFTMRAKTVLELALREAEALGHDAVGPEHLLLGMLTEGEGVGVQVITALGVDPATLRPVIISRLTARAS